MDGYCLFLGEYGHTDGLRLFIRADDYMELRKLKDADGRYLLQPDMSTGGIVVLALGAMLSISKAITVGNATLVNMSLVAVASNLTQIIKYIDTISARYD